MRHESFIERAALYPAGGEIDHPLPFTSSSKTPRSSPPLPSDMDAAPSTDGPDPAWDRQPPGSVPNAGLFGQEFVIGPVTFVLWPLRAPLCS